jgi:hypothetical protein
LKARAAVGFLMGVLVAAGGAMHASADIIDRVLAVADGALITQSDALGAMRLGLVTVPKEGESLPAVLDALIERRLILAEVDRYAPPDPAGADVERALEAVRTRVGSAALDAALLETGSSLDQLRRYLRDDLRIEAYLQQRFGMIRPLESDVADYYRDHAAEFAPRTLAEAHDAVVAALMQDRRAAVIKDWVAGLRRRANITVLLR